MITDINQIIKVFFSELEKAILYNSKDAKVRELKNDIKKFVSLITPDEVEIDTHFAKIKYLIPQKKEETLDSLKKNINKYLSDLDTKIIIVIDDLDRLTDDEPELIFRLVKGVADFNNLIYILIYDKKIVSNSLEKFKSESGERYLEKIVQYPITIPKIHNIKLKEILINELTQIEKNINLKGDLIFIKFDVIIKYIKNIRDINQLINIVSFEYPSISEDINFIDFVVITIIRLKNNKLYEYIQNNESMIFTTNGQGNSKKRIIYSMNEYEHFFELLELIFPNEDFDKKEHNTKRICNSYYFETYFSFFISSDKLSYANYIEIKESLINDDYVEYKKMFDKFIDKKEYFLEMSKEDYAFDNYEKIFYNILNHSNQDSDDQYFHIRLIMSIFFAREHDNYGNNIKIKTKFDIDKLLIDFYEDNNKHLLEMKIKIFKEVESENIFEDRYIENIKNIIQKMLADILIEDLMQHHTIRILDNFSRFKVPLTRLKDSLLIYLEKDTRNIFNVFQIFYNQNWSEEIDKTLLVTLISVREINNFISKIDLDGLSSNENKLYEIWNQIKYN